MNFIIFAFPLLLELALNCIAFPLEANGNYSNIGIYEQSYVASAENYLYVESFAISSYLYATITCLIFSVVAGILGVFTVAVSMFFDKIKVILLLPVYLLLYGIGMLNNVFLGINVKTSYFNYFTIYDETGKSRFTYFLVIFIVFILSIIYVFRIMKKDVLE